MHKISSEKYYNFGDLRIKKSSDNVKMFSFFVDDKFIELDKSKPSKQHPKLTKNQVLLLNEHLKRREHCLNRRNKPNFTITEVQNPIYQEVQDRNGEIRLVNVTPLGFFGKCTFD